MGNPDGPCTRGPLRHWGIKKGVLDHRSTTYEEHICVLGIGSVRRRPQGATIAMMERTRHNTRWSIAQRGQCRVVLSPRK
jgi:hypothetical protein